jgi:hypothetical protein
MQGPHFSIHQRNLKLVCTNIRHAKTGVLCQTLSFKPLQLRSHLSQSFRWFTFSFSRIIRDIQMKLKI